MRFFQWLGSRWHLLIPTRDVDSDRRIVSPEGRARWETFQGEKADVERRLELVAMQSKVIEHVTNGRNGERS